MYETFAKFMTRWSDINFTSVYLYCGTHREICMLSGPTFSVRNQNFSSYFYLSCEMIIFSAVIFHRCNDLWEICEERKGGYVPLSRTLYPPSIAREVAREEYLEFILYFRFNRKQMLVQARLLSMKT